MSVERDTMKVSQYKISSHKDQYLWDLRVSSFVGTRNYPRRHVDNYVASVSTEDLEFIEEFDTPVFTYDYSVYIETDIVDTNYAISPEGELYYVIDQDVEFDGETLMIVSIEQQYEEKKIGVRKERFENQWKSVIEL